MKRFYDYADMLPYATKHQKSSERFISKLAEMGKKMRKGY